MGIKLNTPCIEDMEEVRAWRNEILETLRTPYPLTKEQQEKFYYDVVCSRKANSRWWSIHSEDRLIGFCGLTGIEWENGLAEISLILSPEERGKGYGEESFLSLIDKGFDDMGLDTIYGECYSCNVALSFWDRMVKEYNGYKTILPNRKRWNGVLYSSLYFSFEK